MQPRRTGRGFLLLNYYDGGEPMNKVSLVLTVLLVLTGLAGCGAPPIDPNLQESVWEITIGHKVFTLEAIREMDTVTFDAAKKDDVNSYIGVRLSKFLAEADISEFETLTLEAEDGYSYDITREEAMNDNSILAFAMNGEDLSDDKIAPLMFVSTETSPQAWVGKLKYIRVEE